MNDDYIASDSDQVSDDSTDDTSIHWIEDRPVHQRIIKRAIDIVGSTLALALFSPLFIAIVLAIKLTSKGPVFVQQKRLGYHAREFRFLKFRSMWVRPQEGTDDYVRRLIGGEYGEMGSGPVFKLTSDPRITAVGKFLRRTSLDEMPQFLNVLQGSMSLVGPRPAIPYEWEAYDDWHKKRLSCKPGITGLWQVSGRHTLRFDEMVRMDLDYASNQTAWLDLKILVQTPLIVLRGDGAY
jgi:lipopolysaccharide/colanic/teichoic acid biosynthesis glycosyltransferase